METERSAGGPESIAEAANLLAGAKVTTYLIVIIIVIVIVIVVVIIIGQGWSPFCRGQGDHL